MSKVFDFLIICFLRRTWVSYLGQDQWRGIREDLHRDNCCPIRCNHSYVH